jgi:hypothetical protein
VVIGWVLAGPAVALLVFSAAMKFVQPQVVLENNEKMGWPSSVMIPLGVVELVSVVLYCLPWTRVLGAILLTGYLGGATAAHVRIGEPFIIPVALGVLLWLSLVIREPRLRRLLPLSRPT